MLQKQFQFWTYSFLMMIRNDNNYIYFIIFFQMGVKENKNQKDNRHNNRMPREQQESDEESNQTMPIPLMEHLSLQQRVNSTETVDSGVRRELCHALEPWKNKPIQKRNKKNEGSNNEKLKQKVASMSKRIQELQKQLCQIRQQEEACPHCHFYLNQPKTALRQCITPEDNLFNPCYNRSTSRDSLEFEKIDFNTPLMYSPEMEEKSWIFLGTIMIAMGSKVMDMDGTVNVFKVVKQSVDRIRRQVQKSEQKLSMDFFLGREQLEPEHGMSQLDFDPFYHKQQYKGGLQLEGVKVESVEQYDLFFDQKLTFNVKYDALITVMEYMKENSSISYN